MHYQYSISVTHHYVLNILNVRRRYPPLHLEQPKARASIVPRRTAHEHTLRYLHSRDNYYRSGFPDGDLANISKRGGIREFA